MEINLQPQHESLDATHIDKLIDTYLCSRQGTPHTLDTYRYLFGLFESWWTQRTDHTLSRSACDSYAAWLVEQGLATATRGKALALLRRLLKWSHSAGYIERDFSHWVPNAKGPRAEQTAPSRDAVLLLMDAAARLDHPRRNQAVLAVLIGTGIRRAECAAIDVEDVVFDAAGAGTIRIRRGKGGKMRKVAFDDITGRYLLAYMDAAMRTTGALFVGRRGRIKPKTVYAIVKKAALEAGIADQVRGPHDLRRLFATTWAQAHRGEGHVQLLQMQLGHSDVGMTLHYSRPTFNDVQEQFVSPWPDSLSDLPGRKSPL